jgi:hypothetical protein
MGTLCVLNHKGHSQIKYEDKETIKSAQELFERLSKEGWKGVQTFPGTNKPGQIIKEFDYTVENIVMLPNFTGG